MNTQANDNHRLASWSDARVNPVAADAALAHESTSPITKPGFVIAFENLTRYAVDDHGFQQWVARIDPEDLEVDLPTPKSEYPSRDLDRLVTAAIEHGAINGDPRLELTSYEGDDEDGAGYYVVLHNRSGDQRLTGVTSGWCELDYADSGATPSEQAREYLDMVCHVANVILGRTSQPARSPEVSPLLNTAALNIGHPPAGEEAAAS